MRYRPCQTTRQFDPTIHPKPLPSDRVTIRVQFRKDRAMTWAEVATMMQVVDWASVFADGSMSSLKPREGVCSFRIQQR